MLSHLDSIIFPDRCEVIEIIPSQRYVYPIFKNGNSSLEHYRKKNKCKIIFNEQIKKINCIDVAVRDPLQRFKSGLNTFIQFTLKDNPNLDYQTVVWFAQNYLFLNRHYTPQFLWITNLARYMSPLATLNFISMDQLDHMISINDKPIGIEPLSDELLIQFGSLPNFELFSRIDQVLVDCIGQQLTIQQIVSLIKEKEPLAYDHVIGRSQKILQPTYVLSQT